VYFAPVVHHPLLDLLQPVRLLADVDKLVEHDRSSLQQPDRVSAGE
jgi:hypothetical protein